MEQVLRTGSTSRTRSRATGDARFLRAWERLVALVDPAGAGRRGTRRDVAARRVQNWIYAWQRFAAAPAFPGLADGLDERARWQPRRAGRATSARNLTPERNHRTLELYALFVVALALPELDPDGELLALRDRPSCSENLLDGRPRRRRPPRALDALPPGRAALVPRRARERAPLRARASRPASTSASSAPASSRSTATGPTARSRRSPTATRATTPGCSSSPAGLLGRPDLRYAATARRARDAARGSATPASRRRLLRPAQRLGRAARPVRRRALPVFDCGPLGDGGHGHYDLLERRDRRPAGGRCSSIRAATPTPRSRPELAALVQGHRRAQHGLRRRARPDARTGAASREGAVAEGALPRRAERARPRRAARRGERARATTPSTRRRVVFVADEYWLDRGPRCAATAAPLRPALPPRARGVARDGAADATAPRVVRAPGLALVLAGARAPDARAGLVRARVRAQAAGAGRQRRREGRGHATFVTLVAAARADQRLAPSCASARPTARTIVVEVERPTAGATSSPGRSTRSRGGGARAQRRAVVLRACERGRSDWLGLGPRRRARPWRGMTPAVTATALDRDRRVPQRDPLLDAAVSRERLGALLGADGPLAIDDCRRPRQVPGRRSAARPAPGRARGRRATSWPRARSPRSTAASAPTRRRCARRRRRRPVRPVAHDAELDAGLLDVPERPQARGARRARGAGAGARPARPARLRERARRLRAREVGHGALPDARGRTVAYAKVYAGDEGAARPASTTRCRGPRAGRRRLRVPAALAYVGRRASDAGPRGPRRRASTSCVGDDLTGPIRRLGARSPRLHDLGPPDDVPASDEPRPDRLERSAARRATVRPDLAAGPATRASPARISSRPGRRGPCRCTATCTSRTGSSPTGASP